MTTIPPSAKPNIAPSDDRVKELRDLATEGLTNAKEYVDLFLEGAVRESWEKRVRFWADLLAILDDYSSMRAEVERLNTWHSTLSEAWKERAERAESELARQAPLIEAVMEATLYDSEAPGVTMLEFGEQAERAILRAALALRGTK